ncbi:MAG: energy-coupling factor transporter ATPase [Candidatus Altiarchaeota archaeon]
MVELRDVSYWYPGRDEPAVENLSLSIYRSEFILVSGSSGCGKSTFCRMLNGLVPKYSGGIFKGMVMVDGMDVRSTGIRELSRKVGMVFQDPENQFVMVDVENEIAFGLENQGADRGEIRERVAEVASQLGISNLTGRKTTELSGGEKQKVVLASILALKPSILVLDEPTSQLDPDSRRGFLKVISDLNKRYGMTIVLVEHSTEDVVEYVDRVFDLDGKRFTRPADVKPIEYPKPKSKTSNTKPCITASNLSKWYGGKQVLFGVSMQVNEGECVALVGKNGSGKTTLVKHFNGLFKPEEGSVLVYGMDVSESSVEELARLVGYLPQNPSDSFFHETVEEEVEGTMRNFSVHGDALEVLRRFGLEGHKNAYPRDISVGQRQRLAIASVTAHNPRILVLDEPTRGIDGKSLRTLVDVINVMRGEGRTIIFITQDEKLAGIADRVLMMDNGRLNHEDRND